jgi:K+-transporting ATPase KdpF subunit
MEMGVYLIGGIVALLLFVYLVLALLKPEWFA